MTDAELIARLRDLATNMFQSGNWGNDLDTTKDAADRIEALIAERDEAVNQLDSARHSVGILEQRGMALIFELSTVIKACSDLSQQHIAEWNRAEAAEAKLAKAVKVLTKIAKYDHQAAAMRVLSLKDEQPFAMHLAPTPHPTKDRDTAVLLMDVASTDIAGWAAVTLADIKGETHE